MNSKYNKSDSEICYIPYNSENILISEKNIISILNNCGIIIEKINNIHYFHEAFTHKSYSNKTMYSKHQYDNYKKDFNLNYLLDLRDKSYERLEYLGDRVIKLCITLYLFHRYPKQDEGFMTKLQTKIEDKQNLALMSKELKLEKYFIISSQIEILNGRTSDKIHEDIFEAFIAALFLSNGLDVCIMLITYLLETIIDYSEKLYCDNNYKDQLLRYHHYKKWSHPQYTNIKFIGPPHKREYIIGLEYTSNQEVVACNKYFSYGIGLSKKQAEQNAAKMALILHNMLNPDQYTNNDIYYPDLSNSD